MTPAATDHTEIESQEREHPNSEAPAAWHPDPMRRFRLRYWDGSQWTARVVNSENQVGLDQRWLSAAQSALERSDTPGNARSRGGMPAASSPLAAEVKPSARHSELLSAEPGAMTLGGGYEPRSTASGIVTSSPGPTQPRPSIRSRLTSAITQRRAGAPLLVIALLIACVWGVSEHQSGNAWEDRAALWESRAGRRAHERDAAEARIEDRETQIEGLAAHNAALGDGRAGL